MDGRVLVRMNVLGIKLAIDQVDAVLANDNNAFEREQAWLASFFLLDNPSELTRPVLIRYGEADEAMARISVGTNDEDIYARLIGTLVSAKRCYSNAEYLASIELCALHGEMLANYLCITDQENLEIVIKMLPESDQNSIANSKSTGIYFSDKFSQTLRLRWLFKADVITADDRKRLLSVHNLRIKYFHHWSPKRGGERQDAIKALSTVSPVTARHLEILGSELRTPNARNLERIRRYMRIVSGQSHVSEVPSRKIRPIYEFISKLWHNFLN